MVPAIPLDLPAIFSLLGVAQALLLAFVLLTNKRGNRTANRFLAGIAVVLSITVGATILSYAHYFQVYPHLSRISHPFDFLSGPLLYLYIRSLISREPLRKKDLLHFVPAVAAFLYLVPFYLETAEYKRSLLPLPTWYYVRSALVITQFLTYLVLIAIMVVRFSRKVERQGSAYDRAVLFQVRVFVISFFALWVVAIIRFAIDFAFPSFIRQTFLVLPIAATAIAYMMAYLGLRNPEAITGSETPPEKKYEKSTLTPERAERYLQKLQHAMASDKLYTDGDLTLQKLSAQLSIPAQHLSQIVNERLNQNVIDFINRYRIEEAKRRLLDPELSHLSILAIAEDVGFNSKSSFNAVFKKTTNLTPSEYRKSAVPAND
jgi:AraC-like DNA-binding protein